MGYKNYKNWDDCIHIGACRRYAKIVERTTGKSIPRGCGKICNQFMSKVGLKREVTDAFDKDWEDRAYQYEDDPDQLIDDISSIRDEILSSKLFD